MKILLAVDGSDFSKAAVDEINKMILPSYACLLYTSDAADE